MGSPSEPAMPAYCRLSMPRKRPEVLGADLNRSESRRGAAAVLDKVIGPDMIAVLRPQPNARSVGQPEPAALGLLMGNLQPLTLPDTLDPLVVDCPARLAQQFGEILR